MIVRHSLVHGATVLRVEGHLDSRTSQAFQQAVLPLVEAAPGRFALDLSRVSYVSSAGLRVMLLLAKRARALGGSLVAIGPNNPVREVFEIAGFTALIPILASEDALALS